MSQPVPPVRDTIVAAAPADHRCHTPWTIQVINANTHYSFFLKSFRYIPYIIRLYRSLGTRYQSLDRGGLVDPHDREFIPIREPRDRSRDRSLERGLYLEDELYGRSARQSPNALGGKLRSLKNISPNLTTLLSLSFLSLSLSVSQATTRACPPRIVPIWATCSIRTRICSVNLAIWNANWSWRIKSWAAPCIASKPSGRRNWRRSVRCAKRRAPSTAWSMIS